MPLLSNLIRGVMATETRMVPIPRRGVDYRGKIVLAPMVRSGELPSRLLALHYGADLVWGPETVDKALIGTSRRVNQATNTIQWTRKPNMGGKEPPPDVEENVIFQLHPEKEGRKLVFQMGTVNPELAVQAARLVAGDVAGIDVNAGCPKPFSVHCGMGAALLKTPDLLCSILEALVQNIASEYEIGISVKIRILETAEQTGVLVKRLVATGITGLTVHCRTTPMRPREKAIRDQIPVITDICRAAGVACVINGDVEDRDHGLQLVQEFGVDGAMIARGAETNPSCFRSKADGGLAPWREVVGHYMRYAIGVENKFGNTKYLLNQIIPSKDPLYQSIQQCKSYSKMCDMLEFEVDIKALAADLDTTLNLNYEGGKIKPTKQNNKPRSKYTSSTAEAASGKQAQFRANTSSKKNLSERGASKQTVTHQAESKAMLSEPPPIPA